MSDLVWFWCAVGFVAWLVIGGALVSATSLEESWVSVLLVLPLILVLIPFALGVWLAGGVIRIRAKGE